MTYPEIPHLLALKALLKELRNTSKAGEKAAILSKAFADKTHGDALVGYFRIVGDPFRKHYLTSATVGEPDGASLHAGIQLTPALDTFARRQITGNEQRCMWRAVLQGLPRGLHRTATKLLDRDLCVRMEAKSVNKVLKSLGLELIPEFSIALGTPYEEDKKGNLPELFDGAAKWAWSRKYDGLRCLIVIGAGMELRALTRTGRQFHTLQKLLIRAKLWTGEPLVLDGEVALATKDGSDDFQGMLKEWNRKDHTIPNPRFHCFDCIPYSEFISGKGVLGFNARQKKIREVLDVIDSDRERFTRVKQTAVTSLEELESLKQTAIVLGHEGGILRRVRPYNGKRSKDIYKVKCFFHDEFRVHDIELGSVHQTVNGKEYKIRAMASVKIKYKGNLVGVGSGFSLEERKKYMEDSDAIVGKVIRVRHFGPTVDEKTGLPSLRFPTFEGLYGSNREV